jgi:hypothetical protein
VQLSILRAELAASDAELDHVRDHLAIVLQQLGTGLTGPAATAALAAARGQQQPQAEVDFLREVRVPGRPGSAHCRTSTRQLCGIAEFQDLLQPICGGSACSIHAVGDRLYWILHGACAGCAALVVSVA